MYELILVAGLAGVFASVFMLTRLVAGVGKDRRRSVGLLQSQTTMTTDLRKRELSQPFADRVVAPLLRSLGRTARWVTPGDAQRRIEKKLALAGFPESWDVSKVAAMKVMGGGAGVLSAAMFASGGTRAFLLGALAVPMGFFLPDIILMRKARLRQEEIQKSLADNIDLLTIMVEAGLSLNAAMSEVTKQVEGPLSDEFSRLLQEIRLGVGRSDAFRHLAERTDVSELSSFVTAMVQAEVFGVSTTNVLRAQSKELRNKRRQRAEEKAQKLSVKLVFPLVFCILPSLFVVALGPSLITLINEFVGM